MSELSPTSDRLAIKIADQTDEFFYMGYSFYPGKQVIADSLDNGQGYKPDKFHANDDQSVTVEWMQVAFGFTRKERQQTFYRYVADLVIPRLEDALQSEIDFDNDLARIRLQRIIVQPRENIEEGEDAIRRKLGSMSLFGEAIAPPRVAGQAQEAR